LLKGQKMGEFLSTFHQKYLVLVDSSKSIVGKIGSLHRLGIRRGAEKDIKQVIFIVVDFD
jgi:hypothetical protein